MDCFYRVSTKALLLDNQNDNFIVLKNSKGEYELPGGGIEYGESVSSSLERELKEELAINIDLSHQHLTPLFFTSYPARSHNIYVAFVIYKIPLETTILGNKTFDFISFDIIRSGKEKDFVPYLWKLAHNQKEI